MREYQEIQEHSNLLEQLLELKETELREVLEQRDELYLSSEEANAELDRQQVYPLPFALGSCVGVMLILLLRLLGT